MILPYSAIKNTFSSLEPDVKWSFKDVRRSETNYISHGYHRYPAKFIPQIVSRLIRDFTTEDDIILDPFGGCGTTLVEAKVLGRKSIGFDINPVAKLITETKITPLDPQLLNKALNDVIKNYHKKENNNSLEHSERIHYWFDLAVLKDLDRLYSAISEIKNSKIRRFYLCAFSHILKNCSRWLMGSIKPQIDPTKTTPDILTTYIAHANKMMSKNKDFYELLKLSGNMRTNTKMKLKDSTKKFSLEDDSIDLIVTSPPYVTSYEYADLHQLILLWLGDDPNRHPRWNKYSNGYQSFRKSFVGTKLTGSNKNKNLLGAFANQILTDLPNNRQHSKSVAKYFFDTRKSISEMLRVLKPGKKACIIIGNTTMGGVEIKNAEVATEQMQEAGFIIKKIIKRELSNKLITPWRDKTNGKFTNQHSANKVRVYEHEFIIIAEKPLRLTN